MATTVTQEVHTVSEVHCDLCSGFLGKCEGNDPLPALNALRAANKIIFVQTRNRVVCADCLGQILAVLKVEHAELLRGLADLPGL